MICQQCNRDILSHSGGRAVIGWTPPGAREPLLFCGKDCRDGFKANYDPEPVPTPRRSANAGTGAKGPRKKSRSEILRSLRPKERDISKAIENQFDDAGLWNTRTQSGQVKTVGGGFMKLCRPGTPDRIAAAGLHVWIEVKRPGETTSAEQAKTIEQLKANGALAFVLDDPADLDFVLQGLRDHAEAIAKHRVFIATVQNSIDHNIAYARIARKK